MCAFSDSRPFLEPSGAPRKTQQDGTQQRGHDYGAQSLSLRGQNTAYLTRNQTRSRNC